MTWNTNISEAPKGYIETREKIIDGKRVQYKAWVKEKVILACRDGETVTVSHWLPNESRWCMLGKGEAPVAWMPWPEHPGWEPE